MTEADKSWQLGRPGTLIYRLYDSLRVGLNRRLTRWLAAALPDEGSYVLEAGSGPGFASSLLSADRRVSLSVAADIDVEALREARRRDPALPVVAADLYHLPFPPESFDLVWNSSTLEHLDDMEDALAQMKRVTRAGGHLFIGVPYLYGPLGFQRWIPQTGVGIWIGTVFSRSELAARLERLGLQVVAVTLYFFRFFVGSLARKR